MKYMRLTKAKATWSDRYLKAIDTWDRLFEINDVVSYMLLCFVIIQKVIITNTLLFLLEKCENPLHCKRFLYFFNKKYDVFGNVAGIYLRSWSLNKVVRLTER